MGRPPGPNPRRWFVVFCAAIGILGGGERGSGQEVQPTLPLIRAFSNQERRTLAEVVEVARNWAKDGKDLPYLSARKETRDFEGCFVPTLAVEGKKSVALAIFSDDGADVIVNGKRIHNRFEKPQHLPYVTADDIPAADREREKEKVSLYVLDGPDGKGAPWVRHKIYHIKIHYSNVIFTGKDDIDGCALIAFDGGGDLFRIDPVVQGIKVDATVDVNELGNPAGIVVLKKDATDEEKAQGLALGKDTAAKIAIGFVPVVLEGKIDWKIEGVDTPTGDKVGDPTGGKAAFFLPDKDPQPNEPPTRIPAGGDLVYVYGIKPGRIRVTASVKVDSPGADADMKCVETYEALVVEQKNVYFRVNLLEGPTAKTNLLTGRTPKQAAAIAAKMVRVANVYLRQVGVRLIPDQNVEGNKRKLAKVTLVDKEMPGYFTTVVDDDNLVKRVRSLGGDTRESVRVNDRDKVVQINFVVDIISDAQEEVSGLQVNGPENPVGRLQGGILGLRLKYRIVVGDIAAEHAVRTNEAKLVNGEPDTWGLLIANLKNVKAGDDRDIQLRGKAIAHEMGHMLGLLHRGTDVNHREDGLGMPGNLNLMYFEEDGFRLLEDLDLIQCLAIRSSPVLQARQP